MRLLALFSIGLTFSLFSNSGERCLKGTPTRIEIQHREERGIGYDEGYSTAAFFFTPNWERSFQPFLDTRFHLMNDGRFASNMGIGMRLNPFLEKEFVFGANFYYDYRSALRQNAHQLGIGFEGLSPYVDFRLNGYIPIGQTSRIGPAMPGPMEGRTAIITQKVSAALPDIQAEIGTPIPGPFEKVNLYFAIGPYYLLKRQVQCKTFGDAFGVQGRLTAQVFDGIKLGLISTYDKEFHGTIQGYLSFSFPLGPSNLRTEGRRFKKRYQKGCVQKAKKMRRLVQNVERHDIIPIAQDKCHYFPVNPNTGDPWQLIFVNNTSLFSGNGSFSTPYNSLALAEANSGVNDVIYMLNNNGYLVGANSGFSLKNGQRLHGSGHDLFINYQLVLPAVTPGLLPSISSENGAALTLANNNIVTGINFLNWDSPIVSERIGVDARGSANFTIQKSRFLNNGVVLGHAINANGSPSGVKRIINNYFNTNLTRNAAGVADISLRNIENSNILIADNQLISHRFSAMMIVTEGTDHRIVNNSIRQISAPAMFIENNEDNSKIFFENNSVVATGGGANALIYVARRGEIDFDMRDNRFTNDTTRHILMNVGPIIGDTATVRALFDSNTLKGIATDTFTLTSSSSTLCLDLKENKTSSSMMLNNNSGITANYQVVSPSGNAIGVSERNFGATIIYSPSVADFTFVDPMSCN
ncbi:MAG: inverse autotransporter beta domain-containing protein [Simkaniaceae bacterium]